MNALPVEPQGPVSLAQARAIKERCYAAWHSDPAEAARCASELAEVAREHTGSRDSVEIEALAQWTAAIADITTGHLTRAVDRLDLARDAFVSIVLMADAAQTQIPKVMALSLLGRFDDASSCAVATRDALVAQGDLRSAARVVLNMGSLCYSQDRYAEAGDHYRLASVWFARVGDREHSILADLGRGDACSFLGDLDEAEALYRRAAQRASAHGLHVIASSATQALAELALVRGNYREALTGLESASRRFAALQLPLLRAQAEKALADTYLELNLFTEAEALYEEVLKALDDDPSAKAWVWLHRARLAAILGENTRALAALEHAQGYFDDTDNSVGRAEAALARSTIAMSVAQYSTAQEQAADAYRWLESLELPSAHALLALAAAEVERGARDSALRHLDELLGAPATPLPVRERAWLWHGRALLHDGRTADARRSFEHAVELAEVGLTLLPTADVQRGYLDARAGAYEELLRLELAAARSNPDDSGALVVFKALEQLRARTLTLQLALSLRPGPSTDTAAGVASSADRERLDWIYRRSNRHLREWADDPNPANLEPERQALEARILEQQRRARLAASSASHRTGNTTIDWERIRETLDPGEALVAYGHLDGELFAVALHAGRFHIHRNLVDAEALAHASRALRLQLETQRLGTANLARHAALLERRVRQCLGKLYDMLWRPIAAALYGVDHVRIIPTAALGGLPFAALWDGAHYLVEQVGVAQLASAASALDRPQPPRTEQVLLMADTERLAGARVEIEALAGIWPSNTTVAGVAMTRATLRECAPGADLLHVVSHGEFRADSPLFSGLLLHDGAITAMEIEQLPLVRRPIVVLSACDTALADAARGDEALGLVRAFLVAGASRVIAGLWQVDDTTTADWMITFHRHLHELSASGTLSPRAVSQTLATVQRQSIRQGLHPYHWAGFAVHGGS